MTYPIIFTQFQNNEYRFSNGSLCSVALNNKRGHFLHETVTTNMLFGKRARYVNIYTDWVTATKENEKKWNKQIKKTPNSRCKHLGY